MPTTVTTPADLAKVDARLRAVEVKVAEVPAGGGEPGTGYDDTLIVAAQQRLEARTTTVEGRLDQLVGRVGIVEAREDDDADEEARASIAALIAEVAALKARPDDDEDEEARARLATLEAKAPYNDALLKAEVAALRIKLAAAEADLAAVKSRPDDDDDEEARASVVLLQQRLAALEAAPTGTGTPSTGGAFYKNTPFNSLGADDTARFVNLFAKMRAGWKGAVEFEYRNHNCPVQVPCAPGRWIGGNARAFEYGHAPQITYTGPSGTSMFVLYQNSGYGYPANGVSRDFTAVGFQFNAGSDKDFLPSAPGGFDSNYVQWYWSFPGCSWVGWRKIINGWGTGLDIGPEFFNVQAVSTTPFTLGGSECKIGLGGGFMDSANPTWMAADKPFFEWSLSKSVLGSVMVSARLKSYQMKITYGHNSRAIGTEFDAPDGQPTESYQIRYIGTATNFNHIGDSFKGGQGILCATGATEVGVDSCAWHGNRGLVRCEAAFTGIVKWGLTNTYGNCPKVIYVARGNQILNGDPLVKVVSLDGTLTGIRNPDGTYTSAKRADGTVVPF